MSDVTCIYCYIHMSVISVSCFSYKLWYNYLKLRAKQIKGRCITDPGYEDVNNAFERSLVFMHKVLFSGAPRPFMHIFSLQRLTCTRSALQDTS